MTQVTPNQTQVHAPICRECREGKHRNCDGIALDETTDDFVECRCPPAFGHAPRERTP